MVGGLHPFLGALHILLLLSRYIFADFSAISSLYEVEYITLYIIIDRALTQTIYFFGLKASFLLIAIFAHNMCLY